MRASPAPGGLRGRRVRHLEAWLSEHDGTTELRFVHHLDADANAAEVGPGWEYYLDRLVASRAGAPPPDFDDYYPAQSAYYEQQQTTVEA
ncbi:MAG TPA: hypothetical protein VFY82_01625 [Acidimicrobiales bacterium]|nr:hypothetical protein [Acidimicrobiales bacterium]